jgi:hypothetical protein
MAHRARLLMLRADEKAKAKPSPAVLAACELALTVLDKRVKGVYGYVGRTQVDP